MKINTYFTLTDKRPWYKQILGGLLYSTFIVAIFAVLFFIYPHIPDVTHIPDVALNLGHGSLIDHIIITALTVSVGAAILVLWYLAVILIVNFIVWVYEI